MKFFNETTFTNKHETFDQVLHIHTLNYPKQKTIKHIGTIVSRLLCHSENKINRKAMNMTKTLNILDIEKNYLAVEGEKFSRIEIQSHNIYTLIHF